ncbi:MAG: serine/threonine protein phosphatase [Selenomonadaceae bacterium]|nr:serine/threonine protein phosphatase [Selenomonadaceae bacterium]
MNKISNSKNFLNGMEDIIPQKNDTPYHHVWAIGDLHGCFDQFMSLWAKLNVTDNDLCVFLGDYIDRSDKVGETLIWIMEQRKKKNFVFIAGNHELMMLDAFHKDRVLMEQILSGEKTQLTNRDAEEYKAATLWICNGGYKTVNALLNLQRKNKFIVDEVLGFIEELPLSHTITINGRNYFHCHAGIRPGIPLEEQAAIDLLWIRKDFFHKNRGYHGKDVIIVGHTPTQRLSWRDKDRAVLMTVEDTFLVGHMKNEECFDNNKPFKIPNRNILMVDTGSWRSCISAVDIISSRFQSDVE